MKSDWIILEAQKKLEEIGYETELLRILNDDGEITGWNIKVTGRLG